MSEVTNIFFEAEGTEEEKEFLAQKAVEKYGMKLPEDGRGEETEEQKALQSKAKITKVLGYSNSPLVSYVQISPNRNSPRCYPISRITIHCVVGQCSVEALGAVFAPTSRQASSNYGIGYDGRVGMYAPECDRAWTSSNWDNDQKAITIEVASDTYHPYAVRDAAYNSLIRLVTDIMQRNKKTKLIWFNDRSMSLNYQPKSHEMVMTAHRWFANTICPGDYLYSRFLDICNRVNANFNGLHGHDSEWYYYKDGVVDKSKTGLVQNKYGWWWVQNGKVDFAKEDVVQNQYGWWYVRGGKVRFDYTGIRPNKNGWWRIVNGKVDFGCNSVEQNENGWFYIRKGKVDFGYTGIAQNRYGWWRIVKGKVDFTCDTVEQNENGWFKCENGKVDFSFNGVGQNRNGLWVCKKGKVDFSYNGDYKDPRTGVVYQVKNGKVVA